MLSERDAMAKLLERLKVAQLGSLVIGWDGAHVHVVIDTGQAGKRPYYGPGELQCRASTPTA